MSRLIDTTPRADGFRMPGEFEKHDGCWIVWPERTDNWRLGARPAQEAFAAVAAAIAASEPVTVAASSRQWQHARQLLPPSVRVVEMSADDSWMRDIGPTFVIDDHGRRRGVDWHFNAWGGLEGGLYFPWDQDDLVAAKVLDIEAADRYRAPLVLEGGSIHVDGEGTLIATEECLLNHNRNPELTRSQIERHLRDYTGAEKIIWIRRGVFNDETDGHVDNLACFARPGVVLLTWTDDTSDPQYDISFEARQILEAATDAKGRKLEVVLLPSPGPILISEEESTGVDVVEGTFPRCPGDRLAASYANLYIGNTRVVVPLLDPRFDDEAMRILGEVFPDREVVGVPAREILLGGGNIHCITQQVPSPQVRDLAPAPRAATSRTGKRRAASKPAPAAARRARSTR
jgi:agmatine deiminase